MPAMPQSQGPGGNRQQRRAQAAGRGRGRPSGRKSGELGTSGLRHTGGQIAEDIIRRLQGERGLWVYREIADNDPTAGAMFHGIEQLCLRAEWYCEPSQDGDGGHADFVQSCVDDLTLSWADSLSGILSMLWAGFSLHEIVYKERDGVHSKHDDLKIGWKKFAPRAQHTVIDRWVYDDDGSLDGVNQVDQASEQSEVFLPIEKLLLFRTTLRYDNPEGRSILRNAYTSWFSKTRLQNIEAIGFERNLGGLPVLYAPPEYMAADATAEEKVAMADYERILRGIRADEQASIILPMIIDPETGEQLLKLDLLSSPGTAAVEIANAIQRYDTKMAGTILMDFINIGHEQVGSFALNVSKVELFIDSINAWLDRIGDVFTRFAIPRLLALNGLTGQPPVLMHSQVEKLDLETLMAALEKLATMGAYLFPDPELENQIRERIGITPLPEDELGDYKVEDQAEKQKREDEQRQAELDAMAKPPPEPGGGEGSPSE